MLMLQGNNTSSHKNVSLYLTENLITLKNKNKAFVNQFWGKSVKMVKEKWSNKRKFEGYFEWNVWTTGKNLLFICEVRTLYLFYYSTTAMLYIYATRRWHLTLSFTCFVKQNNVSFFSNLDYSSFVQEFLKVTAASRNIRNMRHI